jgi:hypothetical protein
LFRPSEPRLGLIATSNAVSECRRWFIFVSFDWFQDRSRIS